MRETQEGGGSAEEQEVVCNKNMRRLEQRDLGLLWDFFRIERGRRTLRQTELKGFFVLLT